MSLKFFIVLGPPEEAQYEPALPLWAIQTRIGPLAPPKEAKYTKYWGLLKRPNTDQLRTPVLGNILGLGGHIVTVVFFNIPLFVIESVVEWCFPITWHLPAVLLGKFSESGETFVKYHNRTGHFDIFWGHQRKFNT